jgi:hypothetical protein
MDSIEVRYTVDGPASVESRIGADQQRVASAVQGLVPANHLVALILAGGYGRGEGGYRYVGGLSVPYNDYDYFLVVKRLGRSALGSLRRHLHELGESLGREFGLEVDFAVFDSARLSRLPACLMYSELKWSHRTLVGDPGALDGVRSPPVEELPLAEFSRMMLNRGALLLMNAEALGSGMGPAASAGERFLRYISKGVLASGDAYLAALGRYHPSMQERADRVKAWCADVAARHEFMQLYALALRIKQGGAGTDAVPLSEFPALQARATAAWLDAFRVLESARLGREIPDWPEYASVGIPKGQSAGGGLRRAWHLALALRGGAGRAVRAGPARLFRHPRERIMAALPLLLESGVRRPRSAAATLGLKAGADRGEVVRAFFSDWRRYC